MLKTVSERRTVKNHQKMAENYTKKLGMKKYCRLASNLSYLLKIDLADGNLIIGLKHMKKNIDQYTYVGNLVIILATDYWTIGVNALLHSSSLVQY